MPHLSRKTDGKQTVRERAAERNLCAELAHSYNSSYSRVTGKDESKFKASLSNLRRLSKRKGLRYSSVAEHLPACACHRLTSLVLMKKKEKRCEEDVLFHMPQACFPYCQPHAIIVPSPPLDQCSHFVRSFSCQSLSRFCPYSTERAISRLAIVSPLASPGCSTSPGY